MMLTYRRFGYTFSVILGVCVYCVHIAQAEVKSVSACHGNTDTSCHFISLQCEQGSRIRILTMKYGVKEDSCNNKRNRCMDSSRDGCCVYSTDDCMEYYSDLHAYNLFKECSGKQSCGPMPVPNNVLQTCDGKTSTYAHITYECLPVNEEVKFCRVGNLTNISGPRLSVVFDKSEETFTTPANCSCFISAAPKNKVNVDYVDVRMFKYHTGTQGSVCSSAELTSIPSDNVNTQCENTKNEEDNFEYKQLTTSDLIEMRLLNVYRNGNGDAPQFVWLQITGDDQSNVSVQCFKHVSHQTTPLPPFTTFPPSTTSGDNSNSTKTPASVDADDSNTGAIVAGILVPIILLAIIGGVIAFLVWRRRGYLCKRKQKHATPNKYTDRSEIENSVENSEYAEIGFVPDVPNMEPNYDQVYEPHSKKISQSANGHTYQNVGNKDSMEGRQTKSTKSPFDKIKTHTDRLISFFRKQTEKDFPQVTKRERENSAESYDNLRPVSANSSVHVEITPPYEESNHTYSHTTDESVKKHVALNQANEKLNKNGKISPVIEKRTDIPDEEINAFHVGDAYIEFQVGVVDENHPNLVKSPKGNSEGERPAPPTRPPPSPRSAAKPDNTSTPRKSPKQARLAAQNETRSNSPNCLSPNYTKSDDSPNYDYATGVHVPPRSASPRSDISDVSSEHSYKILEPEQQQEVYDYADVSDDDLGNDADGYTSGSLYEDVDKNLRAESVRKHKSSPDVPTESNEYLEPVTSKTRAISSPDESANSNDKNTKPKSVASLLKRELKEKAQKRQNDGSKDVENNSGFKEINKAKGADDNDKMVKSDNVDTKDYQKVDGIKGVMKMARLFESKDSDSDTSRQSSPRDLQFTNSPNNIIKKSSSNA